MSDPESMPRQLLPKTKNPLHYRGYEITPYELPQYSKWEWAHADYDGPEDGRNGHSKTLQECLDQIDERIDGGFDE